MSRTCNAGYYVNGLTCVACNATVGKYCSAQGRTSCSDCSNAMDAKSYYQTPISFDGLTNACPWYVFLKFHHLWVILLMLHVNVQGLQRGVC
jgi:hypothetical protein